MKWNVLLRGKHHSQKDRKAIEDDACLAGLRNVVPVITAIPGIVRIGAIVNGFLDKMLRDNPNLVHLL